MGAPASESVGSGAHLQPPCTATVQTTSSPPSVNSHPTFFFSEDSLKSINSPRKPTQEQERAIAILKTYQNSDVIAWHTLSQSVEPGLRHRDVPGGLSFQQIDAILTLRDCAKESLIQLLESSDQKQLPNHRLSTSTAATAAVKPRQTQGPSPRYGHASGHLSVVKSVKAVPPHLSNNPYSTLTAAQHNPNPGQTFSKLSTKTTPALVKPAKQYHVYWCTVCDDHSYKNSDDWKKHEKEHEIKYVCMLKGIFEATKDGRQCILCGALNPADSHLSAHNVTPCLEAVDRPLFKRRYEMVAHLETSHGISNGGSIAGKWRCESSKKAWSCGFCVQLFLSRNDRLKHIGTEHFEKSPSISGWSFTTVILGLLLQPEIHEAWERLLKSLDPFRPSKTEWNRLGCGDLQARLERGLTSKETPQSLAKAAYDSANFDWSPAEDDTMAVDTAANSIADQHTCQYPSPPSQDHTAPADSLPAQIQTWSSPEFQKSGIMRSASSVKTQDSDGSPPSKFSQADIVHSLDYASAWEPGTSDTEILNSTQLATPFNDVFNAANLSIYTPFYGYTIIPSAACNDQGSPPYKSNDMSDHSSISHHHAGLRNVNSTLKRRRDSSSSSVEVLTSQNPWTDMPRKKTYRKRSKESATASEGFDLKYEQKRVYDDEGTAENTATHMFAYDDV